MIQPVLARTQRAVRRVALVSVIAVRQKFGAVLLVIGFELFLRHGNNVHFLLFEHIRVIEDQRGRVAVRQGVMRVAAARIPRFGIILKTLHRALPEIAEIEGGFLYVPVERFEVIVIDVTFEITIVYHDHVGGIFSFQRGAERLRISDGLRHHFDVDVIFVGLVESIDEFVYDILIRLVDLRPVRDVDLSLCERILLDAGR